MKIPMQIKIAELESRIAVLEAWAKKREYKLEHVKFDVEPEMGAVWKAVDALFDKFEKMFRAVRRVDVKKAVDAA